MATRRSTIKRPSRSPRAGRPKVNKPRRGSKRNL